MIKIGVDYEKCIDNKSDRTDIYVYGNIEFNGSANIGKGTKIVVLPKGNLKIGDNFNWTGHSSLRIYRDVFIGNDCLFSWDILIMDYDGHQIYNSDGQRINDHIPIIIGNKVWIGCRTTIWSGAKIPDGCIIGCNSFIKKNLEEHSSIYIKDGIISKGQVTWNR